MEKFSSFITLDESASRSLSRVYEHSLTRSLGILSANRGISEFPNVKTAEELKAVNNNRNAQLESAINSAKGSFGAQNFSYIKVLGSYPEEQKDGSKLQVFEKSFLLIVDPQFTTQLIDFLITQGKKWNQDSVFIKEHSKDYAYLYGTNHSSFPGFGQTVKLGKFATNSASEYFTSLRGKKKFTFESFEVEAPQNALGHLAKSRL